MVPATNKPRRCAWAESDPVYIDYHDREWGVPVYANRKLFEMLILEGPQAGLSWITILKKRPNYRQAFDRFDPAKIALYKRSKIASLLKNPGIVRNRLKIEATVVNAHAYLELKDQGHNFSDFLWQFVDGTPRINHWRRLDQIPVSTPESDAMSRALKQRGFKFVGNTICYAFMQAVGMVNDHLTSCYRHRQLRA